MMTSPRQQQADLLAQQLAEAAIEGATMMREGLTGKSTPINREIATAQAAMAGLAATYQKTAYDLLEKLDALAQEVRSAAQ